MKTSSSRHGIFADLQKMKVFPTKLLCTYVATQDAAMVGQHNS